VRLLKAVLVWSTTHDWAAGVIAAVGVLFGAEDHAAIEEMRPQINDIKQQLQVIEHEVRALGENQRPSDTAKSWLSWQQGPLWPLAPPKELPPQPTVVATASAPKTTPAKPQANHPSAAPSKPAITIASLTPPAQSAQSEQPEPSRTTRVHYAPGS
jgi:hypothetical protein